MSEREQRRKFQRYAVDQEVAIEIGGHRFRGRLADVSDGGAFVRLSIEIEIGTEVRLALEEAKVGGPGEVRRVTQEGFAIRFDRETVGRIVGQAARKPEKNCC